MKSILSRILKVEQMIIDMQPRAVEFVEVDGEMWRVIGSRGTQGGHMIVPPILSAEEWERRVTAYFETVHWS